MSSPTALLLYLVFAVGGVGLYLLLPKTGTSKTRSGLVIGLIAVAGFFTVLATQIIVPNETTGYFYLFSFIAVLGAARVVTHPKPVYCAVYFVLVVLAVASLLVLLHAEFLAIALLIIYAGAILVTYLFVIMLAQQAGSPAYDLRSREPFWSVLAGFVLMAAIAGHTGQMLDSDLPPPQQATQAVSEVPPQGNTVAIGELLMTKHVVALEIAGLLLLISMIGAIAMARKELPTEVVEAPAKPLGQIGREVKPF